MVTPARMIAASSGALCRALGGIALALSLLASPALAQLTPDETRRAARAAETSSGFLETGGARSPESIAAEELPPLPPPDAHIAEARLKIEVKRAAERERRRQAEQQAIRDLREARSASRRETASRIIETNRYLQTVSDLLEQAHQDRQQAEARRATGVGRIVGQAGFGEAAGPEAEIREADARIRRLTGELEQTQARLADIQRQAQADEARYQL